MASTAIPTTQDAPVDEPARRRDLLRGPLCALGARQLERDGPRLQRGREASGARTSPSSSAQAALWNYALFFWGEDAVADNLSPYIDAAPLEEQKYFLATQQVDEASHAVFFKRFMQEVCGIGDGSMASGLQAISPSLRPAFARSSIAWTRWPTSCAPTARRAKLAAAVTLYHMIDRGHAGPAGQHLICSYLEERDVLPAFSAGMREHRRRRAAPHRLRREAAGRPQRAKTRRRARRPSRACCAK